MVAELIDFVDDDDNVIGQATRDRIPIDGLRYRCACVIMHNSAGQIYVHRRAPTLRAFPGMHDTMVAGTVKAGEGYLDAARRELEEELGVAGVELREVLRFRWDEPPWRSWSTIYEVIWDGPVRHQESEIVWGAFLDHDELLARLDEWSFTPDGSAAIREYLDIRGG